MVTALGLWTFAPPLHGAYVMAAAGGWLVLVAGAASSIARGDALKAVVLTLLLGGPASLAARAAGERDALVGAQPPATAGRMATVSPSSTLVSSEPRYRTSSSFT
jgi:hypothetical protein